MTDLEAIDIRHSRRSYSNTPLGTEDISRLKTAIDSYNKENGLSIQLIEDGRGVLSFNGIYGYFALVGKASDPDLREKLGYYGELLILEATKLGLGTCFVTGTYNSKQCTCSVGSDEVLIGVIPVGNTEDKQSFKEKMFSKFLHRSTKSAEELCSADAPLPDWVENGVRAVQKAPSAMNRQPVHIEYKAGKVTAYVEKPESVQGIDLGIAKAHFDIAAGGKFGFGNHAEFVKL